MGILKIKSCFTELKLEVEEALVNTCSVGLGCQQENQFLGHERGRQRGVGVWSYG